ncbi:MAG: TolC family protein [Phycisphaerae bacterium]
MKHSRNGTCGGLSAFCLSRYAIIGVTALCGCASDGPDPNRSIAEYRDRMTVTEQHDRESSKREDRDAAARGGTEALLVQDVVRPAPALVDQGEKKALLTQSTSQPASQPTPLEILAEIPDPRFAQQVFDYRLDRIKKNARENRVVNTYSKVVAKAMAYLEGIRHQKQIDLTLAEAIQRTLANNYSIRAQAYEPAISQTQLIEAEALFDAVFFLDLTRSEFDRPERGPTPQGTGQSDSTSYSGGFRKLLPSGMTAQTRLLQTRNWQRFPQKQTDIFNSSYDTIFEASLSQPLLRGFGLDYNRAGIEIARANLKISEEQFLQEVRDRLFDVEQAYWNLARSRRQVMIQCESVSQNYITHENMVQRLILDASQVEVNNAKSRWRQSEVNLQIAIKLVRDAEDVLKNLLNDPQILLSEDIEVIPIDTPLAATVIIDQFAEVRTSLDERNEIKAAKATLEQSRVQTLRAKNETLPRLDVQFTYQAEGFRPNADGSFDQMSTSNYQNYAVSVQFEVPIGQRGPRAAWQRARHQESQAVVRLQQVADLVVQEVNNAVRDMNVGWENIPTQLDAVLAADRNLRALQERSDRVDPSYLETELSAVEQLNNTRSNLLRLVTDYNVAIVSLERAKGTLLRYNNVVAVDARSKR